MSEMVERVARAICCPSGVCQGRTAYDPIKGSVSICQALSFDTDARAAIEAMREPTQAMYLAGRELAHSGDEDQLMNRDSVKARWRAMIAAALI